MNSRIFVVATALVLAAATSTSVLAKGGKEAADRPAKEHSVKEHQGQEKSAVERIKERPDVGVGGRILLEAGRAAAGLGSAVGAGVGVFFTPSKIGCGPGEQCR